MNEELQKALAEIITGALQTAEQAEAFVLAEMPDVVQQLLAWKMVQSLVYCVFGLLCFITIALYWRWAAKILERANEEYFDDHVAIGGLMGTVVLVLIGGFAVNLTWLQIWLAPKVYLIEYAASLVK